MMIFGTYANPWGGGGLRGHKSINLAEILKVNRNLKVREQERERDQCQSNAISHHLFCINSLIPVTWHHGSIETSWSYPREIEW